MTDIVTPPAINSMPPAPLATDTQADFNTKAFATIAAFPGFIDEANALAEATNVNATAAQDRATAAQSSASTASTLRDQAQASALTAVNAPGTSGTSTSSLAVGAGTKTFTTQTGKAWVVGQAVVIARTSDPVATRMYGVIASYDYSSGAMSISVPAGAFTGAGTFADWTISLTGAREGLAPLSALAILQCAYGEYTANADLSASIPLDDTIPQSTEGTQIISVPITPKSATSRIRMRFQGWVSASAVPNNITAALFSSASPNAVGVGKVILVTSADYPLVLVAETEFSLGSVAPVTLSVRIGVQSGVARFNGFTGGRQYGGASRATLVIEEIAA